MSERTNSNGISGRAGSGIVPEDHNLGVVTRGDLIQEFGRHNERRIDYLLGRRRDVLVPVGRIGPARVYPRSIVPIVKRLLEELESQPRRAAGVEGAR